MTNEEIELLKMLEEGLLDGQVGNDLKTSGGSYVWKEIRDGIPRNLKQGPTKRFFNGKENEKIKGVLHILEEWNTNEKKLEFLQKFGWLMKNEAVNKYSAKFKAKK